MLAAFFACSPRRVTSRTRASRRTRLCQEEWTKLLDMAHDIRAFIRANEASLETKR